MIKLVIPLNPITKKNSQQILINSKTKKPFIMPSKKYKDYEKSAIFAILKQAYENEDLYIVKCENYLMMRTIEYPVDVKCLFYMGTKRKVDLTNLLEAIDDILVKAEILADDNSTIIVSHDGSRVLYDKENPRTEVYINEYNVQTDKL